MIQRKYIILRYEDIREYLPDKSQEILTYLSSIQDHIRQAREQEGKVGESEMFVLNLSTDQYAQYALDAYMGAIVDDDEAYRHQGATNAAAMVHRLRMAMAASGHEPRRPD